MLRLSLPSIASMLFITLYNLVDTLWVARLGYQAMAVLTCIVPFFIICIAIGVGTGIGVNALASRSFGQDNLETANKVAGQTFFLSTLFGILIIMATSLFPRQILFISGATPDILELGVSYLVILGWAMPLFLFGMIGRNVYQASGDALRPMIFVVTSQILNIILDPFLIFGWWIFPEMGIAGAALATLISSSIGTLMALGYLLTGRTTYRIKWKHCVPDFRTIVDIYKVGLPSMFMEITGAFGFAFFNHIGGRYGSVVLAAAGVAMRISDLAFMVIIGAAHGLLPIVGFSFGAGSWDRLWKAVKLANIWLIGFLLVALSILLIFTPQIIRFFNPDPELLAVAVPGMRIFCSTLVIIGPTILFITTLQGLSKGFDAMILSLGRQFIFFIPGLFAFSHLWGLTGVWISMPVSDVMGFITTSLWILREYRLQKRKHLSSMQQEAITLPDLVD